MQIKEKVLEYGLSKILSFTMLSNATIPPRFHLLYNLKNSK